MQIKGGTNAKGKINVTTSIDVKPTDVKLDTAGKIVIKLPQLNLRVPDIRLKLWFFPLIKLGGFNISTELSPIEVNLDSTVINTSIAATGVEIKGTNEIDIDANLTIGAEGAVQAGPIS